MKLATLKDGSRDGQLVVVSRDLASAHYATAHARTMQALLDDWNFISPQLEDLYATLNGGKARHAFAFDARQCMAPLPRACQWLDGSAYLTHVERVRRARGAEIPPWLRDEPLMYQGGSDDLQGATDDAVFGSTDWGIDLEAEIAVVTGDVAIGTDAEAARDSVRLLMLVNDWSLRELIPAELAKGFGFLQGKPATAFGPLAVTPDELGGAWQRGRARLTLACSRNGQPIGRLDTAQGMHFDFGRLIAHAARTRRLRAGSIVGGGTVSTARDDDAADNTAQGSACLAEIRAVESARDGAPTTPWLQFGETVRIEAFDADGCSVFGAIEQRVAPLP
jgi:fumarylacetoacetate (FAA) hydrolase